MSKPQKIVLYGTGGVGKSELCSLLPQVGIKPLFLDLESGTNELDVDRIATLDCWDHLRQCLQNHSLFDPFGAVIVDATKAEEWAVEWTLANVPKTSERSNDVTYVKSIEGYGWGRGYSHVYETFLCLLQDLDALHRKGKHIVLIAHDCVSNVPNPSGEDWIRYEPRLQKVSKGEIRLRVKEWCDHLLFVGYDVAAAKGKGKGSGTRTIYPVEMPTHMAKSRKLADPVVYEKGSAEIWKLIFGKDS